MIVVFGANSSLPFVQKVSLYTVPVIESIRCLYFNLALLLQSSGIIRSDSGNLG